MLLIFCRKCFDVFKLEKICRWCSCGSCGGASVEDNSYVHWGGDHHVLKMSVDNLKDLVFTPPRWEGVEIGLIAVPTIRSTKLPSQDPMKSFSKDD